MKSGIYKIESKINGKIYIGQSVNISRRKGDHKRSLLKGKHSNVHLQREFVKYGIENFSFDVLELCEIEELDAKEIGWITHYDCMKNKIGYNMESGGNKGKIVSEETRQKKVGKNNPMFGKKLSEERVEQMRMRNRANSKLLIESDIETIKQRLVAGEMNSVIAKEYGVVNSTIDKIANGTNWTWVSPELNTVIISVKAKQIDDRNNAIRDLEAQGVPRLSICKIVGCDIRTITSVMGYDGFEKSRLRDKEIVCDYKNGLSKEEIMNKYKVCQSVYQKATREEYNKKREELKNKAVELRNNGMQVKDIALELGFARTAISRWTKQTLQSS